MSKFALPLAAAFAVASFASPADAKKQEPSVSMSAEVDSTAPPANDDTRWIKRLAPTNHMVELGIFGGVFFPSLSHEFYEVDMLNPTLGFERYNLAAFDIGGRIGYYPLRFLGVEGEFAAMPTKTRGGERATLYAPRAHLVLQLGLRAITPFVLVGGGGIGTTGALGRDIDGILHFGGGLKFYVHRLIALRLEARLNTGARRGPNPSYDSGGKVGIHPEILAGLSLTFGRKKVAEPPPPPPDRDGDGVLDADDQCPDVPGDPPTGCPPPEDSDGDGFTDDIDACPNEPGVEPDGCPIRDSDNDGFLDPDDQCPTEPGVAPDGCPIPDTDGDGILDDVDQCKEEPETANGYKDEDGCPDKLPKKLKQFTGVIQGIYFATDKAVIRSKSKPLLNKAAKVLKQFPDTRVEISGHTDATGTDEHNLQLSGERAEAVKAYLVGAGIDEGRIETRGAGRHEPIAENTNKKGRSKNRRIEFKLLLRSPTVQAQPAQPAPPAPPAPPPPKSGGNN